MGRGLNRDESYSVNIFFLDINSLVCKRSLLGPRKNGIIRQVTS
jgi:hypothetical protein